MDREWFLPPEAPLGFSMALAQNGPAMAAFAALEEMEREAIVRRAREIRHPGEMRRMIADALGTPTPLD